MKWLNNLLLTASQWIILSLATLLGGLLVLLRVRNGQLHRAQVELLKAKIDGQTKEDDARIAKAKEAYEKALKEYYDE